MEKTAAEDPRAAVGRFAPSPSGRMHLGNLATALVAWLSVRKQNGRMLLRIEELDPARSKHVFAAQIMDDLAWLGLDWDVGPVYQSDRADAYREALAALEKTGRVYPCFCTRAELHASDAPHADGIFRYPGTCRDLSPSERAERGRVRAPALRLSVGPGVFRFHDRFCGDTEIDVARTFGDFLIRRSDGVFAYQLAVTVDDAQMGVTEVLRGRDLLSSTGCQLLLYETLGYAPPSFGHLPLLVNRAGARLSKRDLSLDMGALRARFRPETLLGALGALLGLLERPAPVTLAELLDRFPSPALSRETVTVPDALADPAADASLRAVN